MYQVLPQQVTFVLMTSVISEPQATHILLDKGTWNGCKQGSPRGHNTTFNWDNTDLAVKKSIFAGCARFSLSRWHICAGGIWVGDYTTLNCDNTDLAANQ